MFYYLISGWRDDGLQVVFAVKANDEAEAEVNFIKEIGGGEVNEILDVYDAAEYEAEYERLF